MFPHLFQQRFAEFTLLLHQHEHLFVNGGRQVEVQLFGASRHLADEFLVGEDAVTSQTSVVLDALPASGQLRVIPGVTGDPQIWGNPKMHSPTEPGILSSNHGAGSPKIPAQRSELPKHPPRGAPRPHLGFSPRFLGVQGLTQSAVQKFTASAKL